MESDQHNKQMSDNDYQFSYDNTPLSKSRWDLVIINIETRE